MHYGAETHIVYSCKKERKACGYEYSMQQHIDCVHRSTAPGHVHTEHLLALLAVMCDVSAVHRAEQSRSEHAFTIIEAQKTV